MTMITNGLGYRRLGIVNRPVIMVVEELRPIAQVLVETVSIVRASGGDNTVRAAGDDDNLVTARVFNSEG